MSYDIDIYVDHQDGYTSGFEVGNMTSNVARMTGEACGVPLSWFNDVSCEKALPILAHCWRTMRRNPTHFRKFENPEWGAYDDFMPYLTRFYVLVRIHKTGTIRVG